jgi:PAS domain S-box-containing protein
MTRRQHPKPDILPNSGKAPSEVQALNQPLVAEWDSKVLDLVPISFWIEDFSQVKRRIEEFKSLGIVDLRKHLDRHPQELLDLAGLVRIVWVNSATLELFHANDRAELEGNLNRVFSKESYDVFKDEIVALAQGQTEFVSEGVIMTLSGHKMNMLLHLRVDPSAKHDLSLVFVAITDITHLRRSEDELRRSEATYRQAFRSAAIPMVLVDVRTAIIIDANAFVEEFTGLSIGELMGMHVAQLCPDRERARCTMLLNKLARGSHSVFDSLRLCHRSGKEVDVIATACTIIFEGGMCILLALSPAGHPAASLDRRTKVDRRALSTVKRRLSERELLILKLIATGNTNNSIAERLRISRKTVESHRLRIMQKLDIHKATDLVRYALSSGLLNSE